ncbi:hypothetical protein D3C85_1731320 [compost metagenome]
MGANNARAREAIDKFGMPPLDILEGIRRSQFAPPIVRSAAAAVTEALEVPEADQQPTPDAPDGGGDI